jgi:hypothetical protein
MDPKDSLSERLMFLGYGVFFKGKMNGRNRRTLTGTVSEGTAGVEYKRGENIEDRLLQKSVVFP